MYVWGLLITYCAGPGERAGGGGLASRPARTNFPPPPSASPNPAHLVVVRQDAPQELGLGGRLRLDHELAVVGVEEEAARLGVGVELDVLVRAAQGVEVVPLVDGESLPQVVEHLGAVVLELERLRQGVGWGQQRAAGRERQLAHLRCTWRAESRPPSACANSLPLPHPLPLTLMKWSRASFSAPKVVLTTLV